MTCLIRCSVVAVVICLCLIPSVAAEESWEQVYGGPHRDVGRCVRQTGDNGFILIGYSDSDATETDIWLLKTDGQGNEEWSRSFSGPEYDYATHVEPTADGGYIMTGFWGSGSGGFGGDLWLMKTDALGQEEWSRFYDFRDRDTGMAVQQTADGGFIVTGSITTDGVEWNDILLLKTDAAGNEEWHREFGGDWLDYGNAVQQCMDGGYVIAGMKDNEDLWLIRTDATGTEIWNQVFGGNGEEKAAEVRQLPDGGFIVIGTTDSHGAGWDDAWLIRTDTGGNELWSRTYGGEGSETGEAIDLTVDGGFIITGRTSTGTGGLGDLWLVKTDGNGVQQWQKSIGGPGSQLGYSVRQTNDGGFVATGTTKPSVSATTDLYLVYYRPDEFPSTALVTGPGPGADNPPLVRVFPPGEDAVPLHEFTAYGIEQFGVNVACGNMAAGQAGAILTGAGPGEVFGPHVRGFGSEGTPLPGLSFIAYGTHQYGVNVAAGDLDGDGFDEIITGPGPGPVFGPHVRGWTYDGIDGVSPLPGVSFLAYGTPKWGVNVAAGDIDGDGFDEIVTAPGPGAIYGPHIRGWDVDGGTAIPVPGISFMAYGTHRLGAVVACGDMDGDGIDELLTAPGPSAAFGSHIRGWDYDGTAVSPLAGLSFFAWGSTLPGYGARVAAGADLDGNGRADIVVGAGPDPAIGSPVRVFDYHGAGVDLRFSLQAYPVGWRHGVTVAAGRI